MPFIIAGNIISFAAHLTDIITGYVTNKKNITLISNFATTTMSIISMVLLNAYDGVTGYVITLARLVTIYVKDERQKEWPGLFVIFAILHGSIFFAWQGPRTILLFLSIMASFVPKWVCKTMEPIRIGGLCSLCLSVVYNAMIMNYMAISVEVFSIVNILVTIARWRISAKNKIVGQTND